ncbi:hypothetical protein A2Y83_01180 [Candidatus Falkowbacteria bacterium RBG_13_39_14]|uniref:Uncharacterized protein n=1 Tax=Candidatus Falkowbacteria bacterium RBG_13_39_14 TaxID=1797985 RepID=A0A1F5S7M6_9BACT|nr:MAG: hypothetical protein A2Y83_01180 [Candidatus Falkowbacteria bacterium RBG_13_39_14]
MFLIRNKVFDKLRRYFTALANLQSLTVLGAPEVIKKGTEALIKKNRDEIPATINLNCPELITLKHLILLDEKLFDLCCCLPTQCCFCDYNQTASDDISEGSVSEESVEEGYFICQIHGNVKYDSVWLCDNFLSTIYPEQSFDNFGRRVSEIESDFEELQILISKYLQYAKSQIKTQKVFWLSRHELSKSQIEAIQDLHGKDVEIIKRPTNFSSEKDFIETVNAYRNGFVYTVASAPMYLSAMSAGLNFGIFQNHNAQRKDGTFGLTAVYHVGNREIKKVWENPDPESDTGELLAPAS